MHDKYSYEASLMALHDRDVIRTMACGIAGLSVAADSLSAIKYAKVKPIRDEDGLAIDFEIEGEYPQFGNNDARVDDMNRLSRDSVTVGSEFLNFLHETFYQVNRHVINASVVVTKLRVFAFDFEVDSQTVFVTNWFKRYPYHGVWYRRSVRCC